MPHDLPLWLSSNLPRSRSTGQFAKKPGSCSVLMIGSRHSLRQIKNMGRRLYIVTKTIQRYLDPAYLFAPVALSQFDLAMADKMRSSIHPDPLFRRESGTALGARLHLLGSMETDHSNSVFYEILTFPLFSDFLGIVP